MVYDEYYVKVLKLFHFIQKTYNFHEFCYNIGCNILELLNFWNSKCF